MYSRYDYEKDLNLISFTRDDMDFLLGLLSLQDTNFTEETKQKAADLKLKLEIARMNEPQRSKNA